MRDRVYYILAIAVLLVAIVALVVVFGQDRPTVSQQEVASGTTLQAMFTSLAARVNSDSQFTFRVRVAATGDAISVSQTGTRVAEVGEDYFCLTSDGTSRVCYPYAQLLAVAVPN